MHAANIDGFKLHEGQGAVFDVEIGAKGLVQAVNVRPHRMIDRNHDEDPLYEAVDLRCSGLTSRPLKAVPCTSDLQNQEN